MKTKLKHISRRTLAMILCVLMMFSTLMVGIVTNAASTVTLYCKCEQSWWKDAGAAVGVYYWGGSSSTSWPGDRGTVVSGETDLWKFEVPSDSTGLIFTRVNGSGTVGDWGAKTGDLTIPSNGDNLYTITSTSAVWGDPGVNGEWSTYTPPATTYTGLSAVANPTDGGTVTISATSCNIGGSVNIKATPKTGYQFAGWSATNGTVGSANSASTTLKPSANNAKATAKFNEIKHTVTIVGGTAASTQAGVTTKGTATANVPEGKKFTGWTLGAGVTLSNCSKTDTTINFTATQNSTVTANYEDITYTRLYYSNPNNWSTVKAYLWDSNNSSTNNGEWPGETITNNKEIINDVTYYYVEFDSSKSYNRVIFNGGSDANKTGDLNFTAADSGKVYDSGDNASTNWVALPVNKPLHNITGSTDNNGTIKFYSDSAKTKAITQAREGDTVYVKATPNAGYKLDTLMFGTNNIKTTQSFKMPDSDATVTATFVEDFSTGWYLCGTWNSNYEGIEFQKTVSTGTVGSCSVTLEANSEYWFYLNNGTKDQFNGGEMTSTNCTGWTYGDVYGNPHTKITTKNAGVYVFTFDTSTNKLSVTYPTYTATIVAGENGKVSTTSINAATTVTATANTGYVFDKWVVNDATKVKVENVNSASTKITPLANGGTVTAQFVKAYSVTVSGSKYSSTPTDLTAIKAGTAVTITLPAGAGINYNVTLTDGVTDTDTANGVVKFVMPAKDVTVTVSTTYNVEVTAPTNGTASVDKTPAADGKITAAAGETITVTATPDDGYELDQIKVNGTAISGNTFTVAGYSKVTVTFKETKHTVTLTNNVNNTTSTKQVGKITPVSITAAAISGYTFKEWNAGTDATVADKTKATTTVTATANATVQAVYEEDLSTNIKLAGNLDNPIADENKNWVEKNFTKNSGESTGTVSYVSVDLKENTTYAFKVVNNGTWLGKNDTMTSTDCTNWTMSASDGNCHITTLYEGTYVFKFDSSTNKLSVTYAAATATTKYDLTINAPTPIDSYVTDYTVTYTNERTEKTETVQKGGTIQVDKGKDVTIVANEIKSLDNKDIVSVESWFVNGTENTSEKTKTLTLTNITADTTVYPKVYGKIKVVSVTPQTDAADPNADPTVTVVMGDSADQAGGSTTYKPIVIVKNSSGAVVKTVEGDIVAKENITANAQYSFAPITITGLAKGEYTVTAEIIGYDSANNQVAYGTANSPEFAVGYSYKEKAYEGDVAWVDAVPDYNGGNKATLIKWNNHTGANQTASNTYVFYLPSKVNMEQVPIYHNFSTLMIGNTTIDSGKTCSFEVNKEYAISGTGTGLDGKKVKFMKGSSGSTQLYLNTTTTDASGNVIPYDLPMKTNPVADDAAAQQNKESVTCKGTEIAVDQLGNFTTGTLKKFKGRGNSSWKASCDVYGKYAYNMTLKDSTNLFGLAGDNANGNTKYSLLANNVDEAQVRNSYIYKLAKELGFEYFPNFQMADLYDNGVYMGSYLVTQKVELGKKGLITEPEIKYDDPVDAQGKEVDFTLVKGTVDDCQYQYSSNRTDSTNYNNGGTYLMELELPDRYEAEASWFISKQGQHIVVKSPENASQKEMEYIIPKWNAVEKAVYDKDIDSVRHMIDVESFAKMYLISELSKNLDACSTSYNVLYKSAEDKFYAEPVWDYDWTLGQYGNSTNHNTDGKQLVGTPADSNTEFDNHEGFYARYKQMGGKGTNKFDFEAALCQNTSFWADVETIWENEFYDVATAENTYLNDTYIPSIKDTISMNENRWEFIVDDKTYSWGSNDTGDTFDAAASFTTDWIAKRLTWLNGKINPTMYTVKAGTGATMTYVDNMGNGKLNAYTQFAAGTKLTFTAARQPGMEFMGWSTDGTNVDSSLDKTLTITVPVSKNATYTPLFEITYQTETKPVTYYVDMHADSNLVPTIKFADGDTLALTKVGTSTVYSGSYDTVYYVDDKGNMVDIVTKLDSITADGKTLPVSTANVLNKKCLETGEVWIEATQSIKDASEVDTTTSAKGATLVDNTKKRIYWSNMSNFKTLLSGTIYAYYWKYVNNENKEYSGITWNTCPAMTKITENNYYVDVPKDANRIIFKDSNKQTVDITLSDSAYAFNPTFSNNEFTKDSNGHYNVVKWTTMPADPNPKSYISKYELYVDDTATHSIAPTLNPNATAAYSVADESIATVGTDGTITPKAVGSTKVTITVTGTSKDTATVESTINVVSRPSAQAAYAIMSYQSNTSTFSAVGGTLGTLTTKLAGSAYKDVTTGGIIDADKNTVTYAVADTAINGYADLAVTVTAPSTANENYKFINWTKNNTPITGASENLTVALKTAGTDKYVVTYDLDSVQMVFTYNFVDYDTSQSYEYVVDGPTKPASYKTAPKQVHSSAITDNTGAALIEAARVNAPNIISNYFSYKLDETSVSAPTQIDGIYYVTAKLQETARKYTVSVRGSKVGDYYFQQEVALDASKYSETQSETGYIWTKDEQTTPISDKSIFTLRVANNINLSVRAAEGDEKIKNLSIINTAYHEIKAHNNKTYVGQNFYIQNFYRQNDPVYDEAGNEVTGATDKTFEGAGILSYNVTTSTMKPVSATVRNFDYTNKNALLDVAKDIGVDGTGNSDSNSIHAASGLNYSFVKGTDAIDDITGQEFMKYSQTLGCYSYFYKALTEQSKLYRSQSYVVYSYYVYSYKDTNGVKQYVYVMSDTYATAKVYVA